MHKSTARPMGASTRTFGALSLAATIASALAFACTISDVEPRGVEPQAVDRDGGCGAGRELGTVTQTCTYTTVDAGPLGGYYGKGSCEAGDSDHITCEYTGDRVVRLNGVDTRESRCRWSATSSQAECAAAAPGGMPLCLDWPMTSGTTDSKGNITLDGKVTRKIDLPEGDTICDSKRTQAELDSWCSQHVPDDAKKELAGLCNAIPTEVKEREIQCCVKKGKGCAADAEEVDDEDVIDDADVDTEDTCEGSDDAIDPDADQPAPA
jgi:hypothetical protein